jgi:protocatechuate 3,4-dioxygenase alpha subunit
MTDGLGPTPSQTVGPFLSIGMSWPDGPDAAADGTPGAIVISGSMTDGAGEPVPDGVVETWQADPDGRFPHPDDPRGESSYPGFRNFARAMTATDGRFWLRTLMPGSVDGQAPHIAVTVFARGLLKHLITRLYFPDQPGNADDPVLSALDPPQRELLVAVLEGPGRYRFDIRLQGDRETPFFTV